MRGTRSAFVLAILAEAFLSAQHGHASGPLNAKPDKPSQEATPTLSAADKLLACPAGTSPDKLPDGTYKVGGGAKAPKPLNSVETEFSEEARKMIRKAHLKGFNGVSMIYLVVGIDGIPQNICVLKPAGYSLDGQAFRAVQKYRFSPATKPDGTPVAVPISIEVDFRTY